LINKLDNLDGGRLVIRKRTML